MRIADIYTEHAKLVYNLALQYTQNVEDAEEIVQDVFVSVHQKLGTFKGKSSLQTWIYRIAINKSLDFIKSKKAQKRFALFSTNENAINRVSDFNHPGIELENKEAFEALFGFINELPENQKTVLILLKIEQKSQIEVADILDTTPKAVESMFQRAKNNLQTLINQAKENE